MSKQKTSISFVHIRILGPLDEQLYRGPRILWTALPSTSKRDNIMHGSRFHNLGRNTGKPRPSLAQNLASLKTPAEQRPRSKKTNLILLKATDIYERSSHASQNPVKTQSCIHNLYLLFLYLLFGQFLTVVIVQPGQELGRIARRQPMGMLEEKRVIMNHQHKPGV